MIDQTADCPDWHEQHQQAYVIDGELHVYCSRCALSAVEP